MANMKEIKKEHKDSYPYNFLDVVFNANSPKLETKYLIYGPLLTNDQMAGYEAALKTLTIREQEVVDLYFNTPKMTLDTVAEKFGVSRERIRQVIMKAARKMRYPARCRQIVIGYERNQLNLQGKYIDDLKAEIEKKTAKLEHMMEIYNKLITNASKDGRIIIPPNINFGYWGLSMDELNLSVRIVNAFTRKFGKKCEYITIEDVCEYLGNDVNNFITIRNFGKVSYKEFADKVKAKTGCDFIDILYTYNTYVKQ